MRFHKFSKVQLVQVVPAATPALPLTTTLREDGPLKLLLAKGSSTQRPRTVYCSCPGHAFDLLTSYVLRF